MEINFKNNFLIGDCIHGVMTWPVGDGVLGPCLKNYGEWSEGENIIMSQFINNGDTVIDIGANMVQQYYHYQSKLVKKERFLLLNPKTTLPNVLILI